MTNSYNDMIKQEQHNLEVKRRRTARLERQRNAKLDVYGNRIVETCACCGGEMLLAHKHRTNMCVDCGKLMERWRKAVSGNVQSELRLLQPQLIQILSASTSTKADELLKKVREVSIMRDSINRETTRVCKQCGRQLSLVDNYRRYVSRSKGVYATEPGYHTICKACESINMRADQAIKKGDQELINKLKTHYRALEAKGLPPVTAAARRLMGYYPDQPRNTLDDLLAEVQGIGESELDRHCRLVRTRGYATFDEADREHRRLVDALKDAGLYEEINELMEDWYMED